jgi:hypothetical protein
MMPGPIMIRVAGHGASESLVTVRHPSYHRRFTRLEARAPPEPQPGGTLRSEAAPQRAASLRGTLGIEDLPREGSKLTQCSLAPRHTLRSLAA